MCHDVHAKPCLQSTRHAGSLGSQPERPCLGSCASQEISAFHRSFVSLCSLKRRGHLNLPEREPHYPGILSLFLAHWLECLLGARLSFAHTSRYASMALSALYCGGQWAGAEWGTFRSRPTSSTHLTRSHHAFEPKSAPS